MARQSPSTHDSSLADFLAARDAPCPACGYNLRGLTTAHCPECNEPLELRVGLIHPKLASFITALVGLAAGAGFSGLLLLYFVFVLLTRGFGNGARLAFLLITLGGLVVEGALLLVLIRRRPWLSRRGARVRWALAVGCWLLSFAVFVLFTLFVR